MLRILGATVLAIVENPEVKDGTLYATKVGIFDSWNWAGEEVYKACIPVEFIAGGGPWTLEKYFGKL